MSLARVNRMRGDYARAAEAIRLALKVRPDDPDATEFAADILAARGETEKALKIYKTLHEADPSRASAEEKFAKLTIQIAEGKRQQMLLRDMAENPKKYHSLSAPRNPVVAAIISSAPGFGQIYCGQFVRGVVFFLTVMVSWFFFYLLRPNVSFYPADQRLEMFFRDVSPLALMFALIAFSLHVYAFVDAPVLANKLREQALGKAHKNQ